MINADFRKGLRINGGHGPGYFLKSQVKKMAVKRTKGIRKYLEVKIGS